MDHLRSLNQQANKRELELLSTIDVMRDSLAARLRETEQQPAASQSLEPAVNATQRVIADRPTQRQLPSSGRVVSGYGPGVGLGRSHSTAPVRTTSNPRPTRIISPAARSFDEDDEGEIGRVRIDDHEEESTQSLTPRELISPKKSPGNSGGRRPAPMPPTHCDNFFQDVEVCGLQIFLPITSIFSSISLYVCCLDLSLSVCDSGKQGGS
jgi:hypothetical protein